MTRAVVVGGGPAGLAATYRLTQFPGQEVLLLERAAALGGLSAGLVHGDCALDFGPHRLHSATDPTVLEDLRRLLGNELEYRPRRGLIRLDGLYLPYPFGPASILRLGPGRVLGLGAGVVASRLARRSVEPVSYEVAVKTRLGEPLYRLFYGPYAEKVWGLPGSQIAADQADRRVNQRGLSDLVHLALGRNGSRGYFYPRGGFGRIVDVYAQALAGAPAARLEYPAAVEGIRWHKRSVDTVRYSRQGESIEISTEHIIWTASLADLVGLLDPPPPPEIRQAVARLRYRAVVLCYLTLNVPHVGSADTYYFPERRFPFNRVTEQKNFSPAMIPPDRTVLCMDIVCNPGDSLFTSSDGDLRGLVLPALEEAGLARPEQVVEVFSHRCGQAYPVYDLGYRAALRRIHDWLAEFGNLWLIGRHGLFLHNNAHHSLLMGYRAAETLVSGDRAAWSSALAEFADCRVAD